MEGNLGGNKKIELTPLQEKRRKEEQSAHISDSELEKYADFLGFNLEKMRGKLVLDVGSGKTEKFSREAAKAGIKVVSMSPHLKFGRAQKLVTSQEDWQKKSVAGRAQEMPFEDNTFDFEVALFSVPYYLPYNDAEEYKAFFSELIRTLKPGGEAYVVPVCGEEMKNVISREFIDGILSQFKDKCSFVIEKLPKTVDEYQKEYRLVLTKNK